AVLRGGATGHQLEVVHDHQSQTLPALQPACLGPDVHDRDVGVVVDEDRRLTEVADGRADLRPVGLEQPAVPHPGGVDPGLGAQQALGELEVAHLEREEQHGEATLHGRVGHETEGEGRLSHAGPAADDDEVGGLQAGEPLVEIVVPGGDTGDRVPPVVQRLQVVQRAGQKVPYRGDRVDA